MTQLSKIFYLVLFATVVLLLPARAAAQTPPVGGPAQFFGFKVDSGEGIGRGNAIAVDSKNVYFAWYYFGDLLSGRPTEVMYESFPLVFGCANVPCGFTSPIPTTIDVIGPLPTANSPGPFTGANANTIGIAVDPQGTPHVVYQDGNGGLRHAELCPCADTPNIGWVREPVPVPAGSRFTSAAVDKNSDLHVVSSAGGAISYVKKSKGAWGATESIIGPAALAGLSLAVDSGGNPHVLWSDHRSTFNELVYSSRGSGPLFWLPSSSEIVTSDWAEWISLALDANDQPAVAYWGGPCSNTTSEVIYVPRDGGFWPPQVVDSFDFPSCFTNPPPLSFHNASLAFSPGGLPRITYGFDHHFVTGESGGVAFASSDGLSFNIQAIDSDPVGALNSTSLVVDAADISHILYLVSNCPPVGFCSDYLFYERRSDANTPAGTSVTVNLGDPAGYASPITVTYSQVTQAGLTSVSIADPDDGPAPPANFQVGNPPVYYDFSTTATFVPPATVCIPYGVVSNPSSLAIMHFENGAWVDRTVSNDTLHHIICASVSSFSPIAVFQNQSGPPQNPTLTITASNASRQYGAPDPTFSVSYSGFVNGDTPAVLSGALVCASNSNAASVVGTYVITCGGLTSNAYSIVFAPGVLTVTPAPLNIFANNASRPYGAINPTVVPVVTGLLNGDVISVSDSTAATPASPVGNYIITPAASGASTVLGNYNISLVPGTLTVVPEATSLSVALSASSISIGQSTTASLTLTAPDMVIPIDPSVLAQVTVTSPVSSDILSNNGVCTPVASATPGVASCTITVTSVEPNGRTLNASFPGSADLAASSGAGNLIVTAALNSQQVCIASDFRNVAVPGGSTLWFNSIFKVRDVSKQLLHVTFYQSNVQFQYKDASGNLVTVNQALPDAHITIDPNATVSSTTFDAANNVWNTTVVWDLDDNSFLTGMPWTVPPAGLPADVEPVTVCGTFASDVANIDIGWRWAAAAYSTFGSDNNTLGVKPMDTDHDNSAPNHDHAGTPENFKQFVIAGARGKGGANYTGSYSKSGQIE